MGEFDIPDDDPSGVLGEPIEGQPKAMSKVVALLKNIGGVLVGIALLTNVITSAFTAYLVLAPDNLPKPFYLVYKYPIVTEEPEPAETEVPPEPEETEKPFSIGGFFDDLLGKSEGDETEEPEIEEPPAGFVDPASITPGDGLMFNTGTKIVNLLDPSGRRYIRINAVLEFAYIEPPISESPGDEEANEETIVTNIYDELNILLPVINDALISLISNKTFESIYTSEGKEALRAEIKDALNLRLSEYPIIYVYFTEFVIE